MNHWKIFKSRRGQEMLIDFWAILIFAIIVLIFVIVFAVSKKAIDKNISEQFDKKEAEFMLQSFLISPAIGVDSSRTVGEIIAEDSITNDFDDTEKLFTAYFSYTSGGSTILLEIDGPNDESMKLKKGIGLFEKLLIFGTTHAWMPGGDTYDAETYIPSNEGKVYVRLKKHETIKT